ncbi:P-loop NTPase family protein [Streptomyces amritsarensis]|uniref:hypothetical protein n=1 Tax=Streptomyces amritsarensis TaxID=681158 RepID=UPI0036866529
MTNATMDPLTALWIDSNVPHAYRSFSEELVKIAGVKVSEIDEWFEGLPKRQMKPDGVPQHPDFGQSLFINGEYHLGKTRFVIGTMVTECLQHRKRFRWTEVVDYLEAQKVTMEINDPESPELHAALRFVDRAKSSYFLILDEVGEERYSAWTDDTLLRLLKGRFKAGHPTVIITQLTRSEWLSRYSRPLTAFIEKNCRRITV